MSQTFVDFLSQTSFYEEMDRTKLTPLEIFSKELLQIIDMHENLYDFTLKFYREGYRKTIDKEESKKQNKIKKFLDKFSNKIPNEDEKEWIDHYLSEIECDFEREKDYIKKTYITYFDLFSKQQFVALYSLVESKLDELCTIISKELDKKIPKKKRRSAIAHLIEYLKSVIEYSPYNSTLEKKLEKLREIRNTIVHSGSKPEKTEIIKGFEGELGFEEESNFEEKEELEGKPLKIRKPKFITDFFELIRELFEELIWSIDEKLKSKILEKYLKYWFYAYREPQTFNYGLSDIKITYLNEENRYIDFGICYRENVQPYKCKISLSRSQEDSLKVIYNTANEELKTNMDIIKNHEGYIFKKVLKYFNLTKKNFNITVEIS